MATSTVARGIDQLVDLLRSATPADADRATPCADWTVADLSDHIVNSTAGMVTMARGGEPDWSAAAHHDDPAGALEAQGRELREVLEAGSGSFPDGMAAAELAVHAYDLATGLGRGTADLDAEVAEAGYAFMSTSLTDEMRGDAFGPRQSAPADAGPYERLAAFAGRTV